MTIFSGLLGKAETLITRAVTRKSAIYCPSKNSILISNIRLDGVTSIEISARSVAQTSNGVHHTYQSYFDFVDDVQVVVTVLPTSNSVDILKALAADQAKEKGWVSMSLYKNGDFTGRYRAVLLNQEAETITSDATDVSFRFSLKEDKIKIATDVLTRSIQ